MLPGHVDGQRPVVLERGPAIVALELLLRVVNGRDVALEIVVDAAEDHAADRALLLLQRVRTTRDGRDYRSGDSG